MSDPNSNPGQQPPAQGGPSEAPAQYPGGQPAPAQYPPAQYPAQYPPAQYPAQYPPAQYPAAQYTPTQYPPAQYAPNPNPAPPTNVFAIVALVISFIFPIGGIVLGHVALSQIKRTHEQGHGLALAGTIIGYALTALAVLAIIAYVVFIVVIIGVAAAHDPGTYSY